MGLISRVSSRTYRCNMFDSYATFESNPILFYILGFVLVVYFIDSYIGHRQRAIYRNKHVKLPKMLNDIMSEEQFEKSRDYALDSSVFGHWSGIFNQIKDILMLIFFLSPIYLKLSEEFLAKNVPAYKDSEYWITIMYLFMSSMVDMVIGMPFSLYSQFVIEEKHGFNKMTLSFYFMDMLKKLAVSWAIQLPIAWSIVFTISMVMMT